MSSRAFQLGAATVLIIVWVMEQLGFDVHLLLTALIIIILMLIFD